MIVVSRVVLFFFPVFQCQGGVKIVQSFFPKHFQPYFGHLHGSSFWWLSSPNDYGHRGSNPERGFWHFHVSLIPSGKLCIQLCSFKLLLNSSVDESLWYRYGNRPRRRKLTYLNILNFALKNWSCDISCLCEVFE